MTVTLHIAPEVEAGLLAQAQERGMALEDYLLTLMQEKAAVSPRSAETSSSRADAVSKMLAFGEKHHLSLGEPVTRALLHEGHRF